MLKPGNINLNGRPVIQNADGSHSTEFSVSMADAQGHEVLVPTIVNGKFLTPDGKMPPLGKTVNGRYVPTAQEKAMYRRAWQHYEETGEHMGIFDNPQHADAYANIVHNRKIQ